MKLELIITLAALSLLPTGRSAANTASDVNAVVRIQGADSSQGGTGTLVGKSVSGDFCTMTFLATDHTARRVGPLTMIGFGNVAAPKFNLSLASAVYTNTTYFGTKDLSVIGVVIRLSSLTQPQRDYLLSVPAQTLAAAPVFNAFDFFSYTFGQDGATFTTYGTQNTFANRADANVFFTGSYTTELPSGTPLTYTQNHLEWDLDVPEQVVGEGTAVQGGSGSPIFIPGFPYNYIVGIQVNGSLTPGTVNYGVAFSAADVNSINAVINSLAPKTVAWNGTNGNWSVNNNWIGSAAPRNEIDSVSISSGNLTLDVNPNIQSLTMTSGTLTGAGTLSASEMLTTTGPTIGTGVNLLANGGYTYTTGQTTFNGSTLSIASGKTATVTNTTALVTQNGAVINNAGTWLAQASTGAISNISVAASTFNNTGTFTRNTGPSEHSINVVFNNSGTVNVDSGLLTLQSGGTSSGAFNTRNAATLTLRGTHNFSAATMSGTQTATVDFSLTGSASITNYTMAQTGTTKVSAGTMTFNSGANTLGSVIVSSGTANFNGTASPVGFTNSGTSNFANNVSLPGGATFGGGTVSIPATKTFDIAGLLTWTGTTLTGGGTFNANGGLTYASGSPGLIAVVLNLPSNQTATVTSASAIATQNGVVINNAGTWLAQASTGGISNISGAASTFNNSGTFTRNTGTSEHFINVVFNNSGTVNVDSGLLTLQSGGTSSGAFNTRNASTLNLRGTHNLTAATITGTQTATVDFGLTGNGSITYYTMAQTGTTKVSAGTMTFNSGANTLGSVLVSSGTANFNGTASPVGFTNSGTSNFANNVSLPGGATFGGGTVSIPATKTFDIAGLLAWTGSTLSGGGTFNANGGLTYPSGATGLNGSVLNVPSGQTAMVTSASAIATQNGAVINNAGTWLAQASSGGISNISVASSTFNNTGTFTRNTGGSEHSMNLTFNNSGTVNVASGSLRFATIFTQTAGMLRLNGGAVTAPFAGLAINGGSVGGTGTITGVVNVTAGTVAPQGIASPTGTLAISSDLTLTSVSTLAVDIGGTTSATQYDNVTEAGSAAFARNGTLAVRFANGFQYSIANLDTFTILTSNANTTGQFSNVSAGRVTTADFKGTFAINAAGTTLVVLSDFQGYPDLDVEQPAGSDLADGTATVPFGTKTIGSPGVAKTFTVKNTGAVNLTGIALTIDGTNASEFAVTTALPGNTLAQEGSAEFIVTFTPTGSGLRSAVLHIASNDPNEASFDIALTGTGNFAPVLQFPLADVEVEPTDIDGAIVNFTVSATDFEDDPDPVAIASPASGSLFPLGDSTVIVSATDTQGITTTDTFVVRVLGGDPSATTIAPNAITINSATLRATVNPNHFATSVQFVMDGQPRNPPVNVPAGSSPVTVTFPVSGLEPGSNHTANVQAINATGQFIDGGTVNFTTLGGPPSVTTNTPTVITPTKARLTATVGPNNLPTTVSFYIGQQLLGTVNVPAGSSPQTVSFDYQQLIPGQTITFNAIAINQLAQTGVSGNDLTFNLLPSNSTFGNSNNFLYAANAGWVNTKPATSYGFRTGDTVCSGFLWGANIGWIHAGTGEPNNGIHYTNTGSDYGVNVMPDGTLRGYAWGQNIGWVNFENTGAPAVDLTTGNLTGFAWGQNIGWINLSTAITTQLAILDTDNDGISDAWENENASGNLTTLGNPGDADGDGQSDLAEFTTDTNPLDGADRFRITNFSQINNGGFVSLEFTSKTTRFYQVHDSPDLTGGSWQEVGLGTIPGEATFTNANFSGTAAARKFYRVSVKRPLTP